MTTIWVLGNPAADSGRGLAAAEAVIDDLRRRGHHVDLLHPPSVEAIAPAVRTVTADRSARLLVVGGDGLVHHALPGLVDTDTVVGVVASGTGNDFAAGLGLPDEREAAVTAALADEPEGATAVDLIRADVVALDGARVDPITADVGWAATVVTGGFSGRVNGRADRLRFPRGSSRYTVATVLELLRLNSTELTLTIDDAPPVTHDAALFAIANTAYFGGGMAICPNATPFDGQLDVTVVGRTSALTLGRLLPTVFSGRHIAHPSVTTYRGRRIALETTEQIWADGERFLPGVDRVDRRPWSILFSAEPAAIEVSGIAEAGPRRGSTL